MAASAIDENSSILLDAKVSETPYPFFTSARCLNPGLANSLLDWLENGIEWNLAEREFYSQWEVRLLPQGAPSDCAVLFAPETLACLRQRVGELLGASLSDRMSITAHKLTTGQFIDVHNDAPSPGMETHRLVIHLGRSSSVQGCGGELRIHNSADAADIFKVLPPAHNSAVGLCLSHRSYHSVSRMGDWVRYTIIFSFWSQPPLKSASEIVESLSPPEVAHLAQMTAFLESLGAGKRDHSGGSLLKHLVHTYLIVRSWGVSADLATAGLFHSVYGTAGYPSALIGFDDRDALRQLIGREAEAVAYLFCASDRESIFENVINREPYHLYDRRLEVRVPVSRNTLSALLTIDLANSLEQLPTHLDSISANTEDKDRYSLASSFLPEAAAAAMRNAYSIY